VLQAKHPPPPPPPSVWHRFRSRARPTPKQGTGQSFIPKTPRGRVARTQAWPATSGQARRSQPPREAWRRPSAGDFGMRLRGSHRPDTNSPALVQQPQPGFSHRRAGGNRPRSISRKEAAVPVHLRGFASGTAASSGVPTSSITQGPIPEALGALGADDQAGRRPDPPLRGPRKGFDQVLGQTRGGVTPPLEHEQHQHEGALPGGRLSGFQATTAAGGPGHEEQERADETDS